MPNRTHCMSAMNGRSIRMRFPLLWTDISRATLTVIASPVTLAQSALPRVADLRQRIGGAAADYRLDEYPPPAASPKVPHVEEEIDAHSALMHWRCQSLTVGFELLPVVGSYRPPPSRLLPQAIICSKTGSSDFP